VPCQYGNPLLPYAGSTSFNIDFLIVNKSGTEARQLQKVTTQHTTIKVNNGNDNGKNDETTPLQLVKWKISAMVCPLFLLASSTTGKIA
jgi:hypothetical protein